MMIPHNYETGKVPVVTRPSQPLTLPLHIFTDTMIRDPFEPKYLTTQQSRRKD